MAAGRIRLNMHGARVIKACNRCLFTRIPGKLAPVHPAVGG